MRLTIAQLLLKLNTISNYLQIYRSTLITAGYTDLAHKTESLFLEPTEFEIIAEPLKSKILKANELFSNLYRFIIKNQTGIPEAGYADFELEIDESLINNIDLYHERNNTDSNIKNLNEAYRAICEIIDKELTFAKACSKVQVEKLQTACVRYYTKKTNDNFIDSAKTNQLTRDFALFKDFNGVTAQVTLTYTQAFMGACDIAKLAMTICDIFRNRAFYNFYINDLVHLANAYARISPHLTPIVSDLKQKIYSAESKEEEDLLIEAADLLICPTQRIARYKLTFSAVVDNLNKALKSGLHFSDSTLETFINAINFMMEQRAEKANQKVGQTDKEESILDQVEIQDKIAFIENSIRTKNWNLRGRGSETRDKENKTYHLPRHMAEMLNIINKRGECADEDLLKELAAKAQEAIEYVPPCHYFFYKRYPDVQEFYLTVSNFNPSRLSKLPRDYQAAIKK